MAKQKYQLFVTLKPDSWEWVGEPFKSERVQKGASLGFASEYRPGSEKHEEKMKRQLEWAYDHYTWKQPAYEIIDGQVYKVEYEWIPNPDQAAVSQGYKDKLVIKSKELAKVQPIIVDNNPREGFKILDYAVRSSTANKLWRVLDPHGFQLEISTPNLEELIQTCSIICGVFVGEFYWDFGKNGLGKAKLVRVNAAD